MFFLFLVFFCRRFDDLQNSDESEKEEVSFVSWKFFVLTFFMRGQGGGRRREG